MFTNPSPPKDTELEILRDTARHERLQVFIWSGLLTSAVFFLLLDRRYFSSTIGLAAVVLLFVALKGMRILHEFLHKAAFWVQGVSWSNIRIVKNNTYVEQWVARRAWIVATSFPLIIPLLVTVALNIMLPLPTSLCLGLVLATGSTGDLADVAVVLGEKGSLVYDNQTSLSVR